MPESLAVASLAVVLCVGKLEWKQVFIISIPFAFSVFLVRLLPLEFGVHFIILMILLSMQLAAQLKKSLSSCLLTALLVGMILAVSETFFINFFSLLTGINMDPEIHGLLLHISFGWGHIAFLFVMALVVEKWKKGHYKKGKKYHG
ncbi:hypothetical protein [Candidatus Contubernalis alkaliaceticus]|uniref:hypothetical protein n=1 Tax=Candidatus Contubernalis alkaliaceticus TaxID=338645 RepID=UPI001F4C3DE1|nr:hypothetical protein [Candidatus Contubernalis alkalaceticus]UNC93028.1 hypothetical protein HUE98_13565 [Candidatus Contubernalis alkalaceticus]